MVAEGERQDRLAREAAEAKANRVRFVIEPAGGSGCVLRNVGTSNAYDVEAEDPSGLINRGPLMHSESTSGGSARRVWLEAEKLEPGESIGFSRIPPSNLLRSHYELKVTWRGQSTPVAVPIPAQHAAEAPRSRRRTWGHD